MITIENNRLNFYFPEVHKDAKLTIDFQRTLRIPDDNREYPLPPGLGEFPLFHVEDYVANLPQKWIERGGVFLPMYQAEALWINFSGYYPFAVKIAAGKINAVTGQPWQNELKSKPQDYVVVPGQPWLDGFCVEEGMIRQFVALPLGDGYTAEEQITQKAEFGGIQIIANPLKADRWEELQKQLRDYGAEESNLSGIICDADDFSEMGLAPGGLMRQSIYHDEHGIDAWDKNASSRCFVHLVNTEQFTKITGLPSPTKPPTAVDYIRAELPWFDLYDEGKPAVCGSQTLAGMHSVAAMQVQNGEKIIDDEEAIDPKKIKTIQLSKSKNVTDGNW